MVKIEKDEFQIACKEVLEILNKVKEEDLEKIPKEEIEMLKSNADYEYNFSFNPNISLEKQKVSKPARAIIAKLYIDYIVDEEQRRIINERINRDIQQLEEQKRKKYNPDQIFKKTENNTIVNNQENLQLKVKKENFFTRIIKKIKTYLKKRVRS